MDAHQRPAYYAVITGATRGLGRAIAEALWKDGASLIVCARSEAALREMESAMTPVRNDQQFFWKQTDV